ncbi:amidase family protein [Candidatus Marsarchaeota archaeon]|nr:amidase family protein [Candidatus Marsarchaeota archaeon]
MSSINEFYSKEKKESYYETLVKELSSLNKELNAFSTINESINSGYPFSAKDNICVKGFESTASSRILAGYKPEFSATSINKLLSKDFGFLGKTVMDEFGFGSFGVNCETPARNPFNPEYVAGGSSSGAAVAASIMKYHLAIAESTGGSISTPAAFCGVVGFTPTYGTVSRYGLIDYANSLDKIGIISRHAEDIREAFSVIQGEDPQDSTSVGKVPEEKKKDKIIILKEAMEHAEEKVRSSFARLIGKLENMGYKVEEKSFEPISKAVSIYYIISMAEASTNLAKYTGFKYGYQGEDFTKGYNAFFTEARNKFGEEAKRRVILGTFVRGASVKSKYYGKALRARALIIDGMNKLLGDGYILTPTMPITTPKFTEVKELTPLQSYASDILTIPPNLCGFPHISFPYDYVGGMPLGAQLVSSHFNDNAVIGFAEQWEKQFEYKFRYNLGSL